VGVELVSDFARSPLILKREAGARPRSLVPMTSAGVVDPGQRVRYVNDYAAFADREPAVVRGWNAVVRPDDAGHPAGWTYPYVCSDTGAPMAYG
jgi:hypothetical protein